MKELEIERSSYILISPMHHLSKRGKRKKGFGACKIYHLTIFLQYEKAKKIPVGATVRYGVFVLSKGMFF